MNSEKVSPYTWAGLLLAFFGAPLVIYLFGLRPDSEPLTNAFLTAKEVAIFLVAALLLLLVVKGEKLNLNSIGLHNRHWGKSVLWGLLLAIICFAVLAGLLGLFQLVGISFGDGAESHKYDNISLWVMTLIVVRAGIVEEICYRGYIMERLEKISGKWVVYFLLPALIFGLLHYKQGIGGIIIATVMGLVLAYAYWKKRDLKMNIIAHFLVDFIPNVLLPLLSGN
jgi:hypothetical protein